MHRSRLVATGTLPLASEIESGSGAVYTVDVSADGARIAATGSDGAARIWTTVRPDEDPVVLRGHRGFLTAVVWSPDATKLATTSDDGTARIWTEPGSGRQPLELRGHRGRVVYAAWEPSGGRLATAGMDGSVRIWNAVTGEQEAELDGHTGDVRTVAWSPDGGLIASGSADRTARLWDGRTLAPRGVIIGYHDTVHGLDFSPDSRILATASDDTTVQMWDVSDPAAPRPLGIPITAHTGPVWAVGFSPDGRRLVSASVDGTARVWSIARPEIPVQLGATLSGAASSLFSATFAPDGERVVTSGADGRIRIWTLPGTVLGGHVGRVIAPAIAGDRMLTGGSGDALLSWDLSDPSQPRPLDAGYTVGNSRIDQLSLSADGTLSAVATGRSTVEVRAVGRDGRLGAPRVLALDTLDQHRAVFAPHGSLLLTGARDDSFQLWRVAPDGAATRSGPPLTHGSAGTWATSAAWSPDGTRLVTGGVDGNVNLWDVSDPARPRRLAESTGGPAAAINALAWSGDVVVAGGDGGVLGFWRVDDDRPAFLTERRQQRGGTVRTLDFINDGKQLIAAGDGQTAVVWITQNPAAPTQWGEQIGPAGAGRWYGSARRDGSAVVIGGDHGSLFVVLLDPADAVSRIEAAAPPLSDAERERFGLG